MSDPTPTVPSRKEALSQALRGLRRLRRRGPGEIADAMGLERRTYENFEAGKGKIHVDRIHEFAKILDVDPFAILAAVEIRSPDFAVACAEHKLMMHFMMNLQEFDANARGNVTRLNAATIVSAFTLIFDLLAKEASEGDDFVKTWMGEGDPPAEPAADASEVEGKPGEAEDGPDSSDET